MGAFRGDGFPFPAKEGEETVPSDLKAFFSKLADDGVMEEEDGEGGSSAVVTTASTSSVSSSFQPSPITTFKSGITTSVSAVFILFYFLGPLRFFLLGEYNRSGGYGS